MVWNTVRFSTRKNVLRHVNAHSMGLQKSLPVEIVEMIVQEVLRSHSRAFASIAALSVVSRQFRYIVLRAYFSRLSVHRLTKASRIGDILILNSYSWVR